MKITFRIKSVLGKWSAGLSIAFIIMIWLKIIGLMPVPSFAIAFLGLAGFLMGIAAILRNKERSILTYISIPVGLLIIFWILAELIYPH